MIELASMDFGYCCPLLILEESIRVGHQRHEYGPLFGLRAHSLQVTETSRFR